MAKTGRIQLRVADLIKDILEEYCSLTERSQADVLSELIEAVLLPRIRSLQSPERDDSPPA
jgi:hypothetical protein